MERLVRIELASKPWQGLVLTIIQKSQILAGAVGFEPTRSVRLTDLESVAVDHLAILLYIFYLYIL